MSSCELKVKVTPRSSRNRVEVAEPLVKVWVTAAPADGQANEAVRIAVADALNTAKSNVSIVRGHTSREKSLEIVGMDLREVMRRLSE